MPSARPASAFGRTLLVVGPETLLAERAVAAAIRQVRGEDPGTEIAPSRPGGWTPAH